MKIEYDPTLDLLYIWFGTPGQKAAQTVTVVPGVHADFDVKGKLIGIEVLDAVRPPLARRRLGYEYTGDSDTV